MSKNRRKPKSLLHVLTYHRVAELDSTPWLNARLISATPARFEQQMNLLSKNYNVVSMEDVLDAVKNGKCLPNRCVLITFDDAYRDFAENAWPALKSLNLPVTVFVPTAYPDQPDRLFWWDKLHQAIQNGQTELQTKPLGAVSLKTSEERNQGLKRLQSFVKSRPHAEAMTLVDEIYQQSKCELNGKPIVLGWDELRKLAKEGVTLGAHTQTHPILTRIPLDRAREEIAQSQKSLKKEIGTVLPIFSYPDGGHNDAIINIIKEEGFLLVFNGPGGYNDLSSVDLFRIRRINITPKSSQFIFKLRLTSWFSSVEKFRLRKRIKEITTTVE